MCAPESRREATLLLLLTIEQAGVNTKSERDETSNSSAGAEKTHRGATASWTSAAARTATKAARLGLVAETLQHAQKLLPVLWVVHGGPRLLDFAGRGRGRGEGGGLALPPVAEKGGLLW